jgi:hypothetical protein
MTATPETARQIAKRRGAAKQLAGDKAGHESARQQASEQKFFHLSAISER